jgi:hypothetical protein
LKKIIKKNQNKKNEKKINLVGKYCSNPQCFVKKAIIVILNQLSIKKIKLKKIILEKNHNKKNHVRKHCSNP